MISGVARCWEAMVIVRGPDAYVSPSWYASKKQHGRVVPTWNYVTAYVYGRLVVRDVPAWVEAVVRRLTAKHEAAEPQPWTVDDAPPGFIAGQLRAIVGIEVMISRVEAKAKLSQNRPAADIDGVIAGLQARGDDASAAAVRAARKRPWPAYSSGRPPRRVISQAEPSPTTPQVTPGPSKEVTQARPDENSP